jgi:general secretion pathway protein N
MARTPKRTFSPAKTPAHERAPWRWAVLGAILGLIVATTLLAPARWLGFWIAYASGNRVQIDNPLGTIWKGSGQLVLTGGARSRDRTVLPGQMRWTIAPSWKGARLVLDTDCCTPLGSMKVNVMPSWGGGRLAVNNTQARLPADLLDGLGAPFNTLELRGEISWQTRDLTILLQSGRMVMSGQVDVTARAMSSRLSPLRPLGSYIVTLVGGAAPTLRLSTLEGALLLTGNGQWTGGRLRFQGVASPAPGMQAQLANLLNAIGRRQGEQSLLNVG